MTGLHVKMPVVGVVNSEQKRGLSGADADADGAAAAAAADAAARHECDALHEQQPVISVVRQCFHSSVQNACN